jgi:hypothetical protein
MPVAGRSSEGISYDPLASGLPKECPIGGDFDARYVLSLS